MRVRVVHLLPLLAAAVGQIGCGDDTPPRPTLASCSAGWQPLLPEATTASPRALAFGQDRIVYSQDGLDGLPVAIIAVSTADGSVSPIVADWAWDLWVDGDQVLYSKGEDLRSVPLAGGDSQLIIDGPQPTNTVTIQQALDASGFYWARDLLNLNQTDTIQDYSLWRAPRTGGTPQQIGGVTVPYAIKQIAIAPDALVLGGYVAAFAVPFDGSPVRILADAGGYAAEAEFVGADATGVYYTRPVGKYDPNNERFEIVRSPAAGGPLEPFWPSKPDSILVDSLWPDPQGGWFATGLDRFDDGAIHASFWWIDADGNGRLGGCDGRMPALPATADARPAFSADAAYVSVHLFQVPRDSWTIVKVPRRAM